MSSKFHRLSRADIYAPFCTFYRRSFWASLASIWKLLQIGLTLCRCVLYFLLQHSLLFLADLALCPLIFLTVQLAYYEISFLLMYYQLRLQSWQNMFQFHLFLPFVCAEKSGYGHEESQLERADHDDRVPCYSFHHSFRFGVFDLRYVCGL